MTEEPGCVVADEIQILMPVEIGDPGACAAFDGEREGNEVQRLARVSAGEHIARAFVARLAQGIGGRETPLGARQRLIERGRGANDSAPRIDCRSSR